MRRPAALAVATRTPSAHAWKATRPAGDTACAATCTGAVIDTYPDQGLIALQHLSRAALREVHDSAAIAHCGGRAHAALAYAYASADPLQSDLRMISPSHAPLTVSHLHLLDVRWTAHPTPDDGVCWEMSWEPVTVLPLGTP